MTALVAPFQDAFDSVKTTLRNEKLITPFNVVTGLILLTWLPLVVYRFYAGCGAISSASDTNPWGVFIGFNVCCGVALSAGGFTIGTAVYLFKMKEYHHNLDHLGETSLPVNFFRML